MQSPAVQCEASAEASTTAGASFITAFWSEMADAAVGAASRSSRSDPYTISYQQLAVLMRILTLTSYATVTTVSTDYNVILNPDTDHDIVSDPFSFTE